MHYAVDSQCKMDDIIKSSLDSCQLRSFYLYLFVAFRSATFAFFERALSSPFQLATEITWNAFQLNHLHHSKNKKTIITSNLAFAKQKETHSTNQIEPRKKPKICLCVGLRLINSNVRCTRSTQHTNRVKVSGKEREQWLVQLLTYAHLDTKL